MDMLSARSADAAASDGQLLARIARGDKDAVTALYRRLERPLFAFLVKTLRDREAAADVLNETMLDVWRQAGRFEGRSTVSTWLMSIARYKALAARRRRTDAELDEHIEATVADTSDDPETALAKKTRNEVLRRALTRLSSEHRQIIDLVYYHEKSVEEAAQILQVPAATVKTRMFYARQKLRVLLGQRGEQAL